MKKPLHITVKVQPCDIKGSTENAHVFQWAIYIGEHLFDPNTKAFGYKAVLTAHPCSLYDQLEYLFDSVKENMLKYIKEQLEK
jgi:hypothetical protein